MLECDYLVIGTGASGMAFLDAIVSHSPERTVVAIDKFSQPGGHWNHAYDFVRLHQPARYYGVASEKLERDGETAGFRNEDLSTKREILDYYRLVMDKLVKTGRVVHCGECTYQHDDWDANNTSGNDDDNDNNHNTAIPIRTFVDKDGMSHTVRVKRRVVDATYLKIQVPSINPPRYSVDPSVECVPVNDIHTVPDTKRKFVVVGAGKTGIDAILHLLDQGVDPSRIAWVMPRDPWLVDRAFFDPQTMILRWGIFFTEEASHRESLLLQEREGMLLRLDENVWPTKYNCATIHKEELHKLRSIRNVIRGRGRVSSVTKTHLVMTGSDVDGKHRPEAVPYEPGALIVDCSSNGLTPRRPEVPIFSKRKITIQSILYCVTCLSADLVGYVECHEGFDNDEDRNRLLRPVPFPDSNTSVVRTELLTFRNMLDGFGMDPRTKDYFEKCRLNINAHASKTTLVRALAGEMYRDFSKVPASMEAKKRYYKEGYGGGTTEFEFRIYSDPFFNTLSTLRRVSLVVRAVILGAPVAVFLGFRFLSS